MSSALRLYKQELSRCRDHFQQIDLHKERGYLMKFTTFSANVENIMPFIPRSEHETLFQELLTKLDSPRIYCTYHLGSYRILTSLLFRRGVDCVLLLGSNANRHHGEG